MKPTYEISAEGESDTMTKKIDPGMYDTDKSGMPSYLKNYEAVFAPLAECRISLLELGINKGGSVQMWRDYFENGSIVGLDIRQVDIDDPSERIRVYRGRQEDTGLLRMIAEENAPDGFDIIIDDCSHIGELTRISFWYLFDNHLKPGGIYVIEDWGTGYWDTWFDGRRYRGKRLPGALSRALLPLRMKLLNIIMQRSPAFAKAYARRFPGHDYGMAGFVKELVDECGRGDITHPQFGASPHEDSKIRFLNITHGQVFVFKA